MSPVLISRDRLKVDKNAVIGEMRPLACIRETSGVTGGEAEWRLALPGKLNVKIGPPLSLHFGFSIRLVFIRLCFLRFSEYFSVIKGFTISIHIWIHHHFSNFFLSVG